MKKGKRGKGYEKKTWYDVDICDINVYDGIAADECFSRKQGDSQ